MNDDQLIAALRRYGEQASSERPLAPDASARIEARIDAAFDAASGAEGFTTDDLLGPTPSVRPAAARRRRLSVVMASAAAAIMLVTALVALRPDTPEPTATEPVPPVPPALLEPGTRWELATRLDLDAPADQPMSTGRLSVRVDGGFSGARDGERVVIATARVSTTDAPSLQYLGSVEFVVEPSGTVRVPLVLLDPERAWIDCDATIDVGTPGSASCGSDAVEYRPDGSATSSVDTAIGSFEATGTTMVWSIRDAPGEIRTTIWTAADLGPVRIDVDSGDTTQTWELVAFDRPATPSTTRPTGE